MLTPKNPNTTPHGGWRYKSSFSGYTSGPFYDLDSLLNDVRTHRNANGISTPLGWRHELLHEACLQNGWDCKENNEVHEDTLVTNIGRALWVELHAYAEAYPDTPTASEQQYAAEWLGHWVARIPKFSKCGCRSSYDTWTAVYPAPLDSGVEFRRWTTIIHDRVNKKLGRPLFNPENAKHPVFQV